MKKLIFLNLFLIFNDSHALEKTQVFNLEVTEKGFVPDSLTTKPGANVVFNVTRKTDSTCATQIKVPSKNIIRQLPLNKTVTIKLGKLEKGEVDFGCEMDMITGVLFVK